MVIRRVFSKKSERLTGSTNISCIVYDICPPDFADHPLVFFASGLFSFYVLAYIAELI